MKKIFTVIILCLSFLTACSQQKKGEVADYAGIKKEMHRGPVNIVVTTDKKQITVAEHINLSISAIAPEDYDVELPVLSNKLDQFTVVDFSTEQPKLLDDGTVEVSRSYVLEPFLSGNYTIPPLTLFFAKKGSATDKRSMVRTDKIKIVVTSLLPEGSKDFKINDIVDPVKLPYSVMVFAWGFVLLVLVVAVIVALLIMRRRRLSAMEEEVIRIPPHEIALSALDKLAAEDLPAAGEIKLFYQRVSSILRTYIEDRFGLKAPEQTTEEFMISLRESSALPQQYQSLLETFLTHCDLVKFAELKPNEIEIKKTFESCRAFVVGTIEREEVEGRTSNAGNQRAEEDLKGI